jgi:hypothetical protein
VNWATLGVSICVLLVAIVALFRIQKIHLLVNSQLDRVMALYNMSKERSAELSRTIIDTGGIVPPEKTLAKNADNDSL